MSKDFEFEDMSEQELAEIDAFVEHLRDLKERREPSIRIVNKGRLNEFAKSLAILSKIAKEAVPEAKIEWTLNEESDIGLASITIETEEFTIMDSVEFFEGIKNVSNITMYPLTNGKMRVDAAFYNMLDNLDS